MDLPSAVFGNRYKSRQKVIDGHRHKFNFWRSNCEKLTLNNSMQSAAQSGSSVQDTQATIVFSHFCSLFKVWSIWLLMPRSLTGVPFLSNSRFLPSPSTVNGDPPPHNWYISGVQIVPSKSKAISFGRFLWTPAVGISFEALLAITADTRRESQQLCRHQLTMRDNMWRNVMQSAISHLSTTCTNSSSVLRVVSEICTPYYT